ncbi:MAG: hypothetical protein ACRC5A_13740, partial [Enterobacteriaceae bacterium]
AVVVLVVLANDHLIMITAHFPLFFLKIRHFFYRYQLVDPKDPTYNKHLPSLLGVSYWTSEDCIKIKQSLHDFWLNRECLQESSLYWDNIPIKMLSSLKVRTLIVPADSASEIDNVQDYLRVCSR